MSNKNNSFKIVSKQPTGAKVIAYFIVIFVCLCAVLSAVFSGVLLYQNNKKSASADEVVTYNTFDSSYYFLSQGRIAGSGYLSKFDDFIIEPDSYYPMCPLSDYFTTANFTCFFSTSITQTATNLYNISFDFSSYANANPPHYYYRELIKQDTSLSTNAVISVSSDNTTKHTSSMYGGYDYLLSTGDNFPLILYSVNSEVVDGKCFGSYFEVFVMPDFNCDVAYVHTFLVSENGYNLWFYNFYDINGNILELCFYTANTFSQSTSGYILNRKFYTLQGSVDTTNAYNHGLNDGRLEYRKYSSNWNDIYNEGYQAGYFTGDSAGYNRGYADGATDENDYTFLGLLGAVVDAPVRAFSSLLNFNLLGFNMLNFFTGLLTLSLILWIIGKILGGK